MGKGNTGKRCVAMFAAVLLMALAVPARMNAVAAASDILVISESKSGKTWGSVQQLDIFDSAYYRGKVLAPGSIGTYSFRVQNQSELAAACQVSFTEQNPAGVPIRYRLLEDGEQLQASGIELTQDRKERLDADSAWLDISGLAAATKKLEPGSGVEYTLEWKWDTTDDAADTLLGIAARDGLNYTLDINVMAEQELDGDAPKTGDGTWLDLLVDAGISVILLLTLAVWILVFWLIGHGRENGRRTGKGSVGAAAFGTIVFLAVSSGLVFAKMTTAANGSGAASVAAFVIDAQENGTRDFHIDYCEGTERYYSVEYPFAVTNKAGGKVCEVAVEYDVSVVIEVDEGFELPDGIEVRIDGQHVPCTHDSDERSEQNIYTYTLENAGRFEAGVEDTQEHTVTFVIDSERTVNCSWQNYIDGTVKIHAEQID